MSSCPREKPLLGGEGLRKLTTVAAYHATEFLARILGRWFWYFERKRSRLIDEFENERSEDE
jgi:hypothetical protein